MEQKQDQQDTSYVTMADILQEQEELEETSRAVLGGSDEKNCTYSKGYVGRQALYACLTCVPEARGIESKRSGICLACSLQCHDNHELLELYTKRNFRCDCGGKRMPEVKCKLEPRKEEENSRNRYNQNFSGLYCVCHRPYPDPDDDVDDEMIQCVVCEDWYHMRHLDVEEPKSAKDYGEMVCGGCMEANPFLKHYVGKIEDTSKAPLDDTVQVDVTGLDESNVAAPDADPDTAGPSEPKQRRLDDSTVPADELPKDKPTVSLDICTMPPLDEDGEKAYKKGASFWVEGWRKFLCQCKECTELYKKHGVEYLLNEKDTVKHYEEVGKQKHGTDGSAYEQGMQMLGQLDRVTQVDMLTEYNRMTSRLREFLDQFVTNQQVVTRDDINEFFATLNKERRESSASSGPPPYFCR
ncbi:putative E3 ubiquitin-protein ligase UBR7 [Anopheles stephensi]|uniref:putative E3 ubiquitin-protein ligase UBR7 n=1 Tax=Anopheles stephensi TaxID=30069 RepID=UPI001658B995|nr:putative E3 ubiquitin-protein ligase UBR7 [Anopheles stephensi]XP_035908787.1 putative E3 ubiquitin-protein ligase UBR7 [Anopheles stephensi]